MSGLAAVLLTAHNTLGVLHRDTALGLGDVDDKGDDAQADSQDHQDGPPLQAEHGGDSLHALRNDTDQQDHGDTVADTLFGDLVTQPHDEHGAGDHGQNDNDAAPSVGTGQHMIHVLQSQIITEGHDGCQHQSGAASDTLERLLALFAALFGQTLKSGDGHLQQLDDNRAVDVGVDGHGEDGSGGKTAAGQSVEVAQQVAAVQGGKLVCQSHSIHERNVDSKTQTVDDNGEQDKGQFLAQFRNLPRIFDGLDHLRSPLLLQQQSFLWQKR